MVLDISSAGRYPGPQGIPEDVFIAHKAFYLTGNYGQDTDELAAAASRLGPLLRNFIVIGDEGTLEHSIRVGLLARAGAKLLGLPKGQQDLVEAAGLAHDLGKQDPVVAGVVLNGRTLTPKERGIVNRHARIGFDMLYDGGDAAVESVTERLGNLMGQVALHTLFSHSNSINLNHRGVDNDHLANLVHSEAVTKRDALTYTKRTTFQLLTIADVMDALLSDGPERKYRFARLASEGKEPVSVTGPDLAIAIAQTLDVHQKVLDDKVVGKMAQDYTRIVQTADCVVSKWVSLMSVEP